MRNILQTRVKRSQVPTSLFAAVRYGYLQRRATNRSEPTLVLPIVHDVLRAPGQRLDSDPHDSMEPRFGYDFSRMPVRTTAPAMIQPKLTIGQPGDKYEREADRVADLVTSMPDPRAQRQVEPEEEEEGEPVLAKKDGGRNPQVGSSLDAQIRSLRGGGRPLSPSVRSFFEPRFGRDFGQVRIHISVFARHLGLWAKPAVELANIGQFQMHPLKRDLNMSEVFLIHFFAQTPNPDKPEKTNDK